MHLSTSCRALVVGAFVYSGASDGVKISRPRWIRTTSLPAAIIGLCVAPYIGDLFNKQVHSKHLTWEHGVMSWDSRIAAVDGTCDVQVAFIDMASIDQTDAEQKKQGIYSIAEFLRMSGELQVLWSADYLSRLSRS